MPRGGYSIHTILPSMYLEKILLLFQLTNQKRIFFIFFSKCSSQKETSYLFENSIYLWKQKKMKSATVGLKATLILIM